MIQHWIWFTTRRGIGLSGRAALLRLFGSAERIHALTAKECCRTEGFEARWLEPLMDKSLDEAERILRQCDDKEISLLTYCDEAYPTCLKNIATPPALLYYRGKLPDFNNEPAIAVVGSRKCTPYGLLNAKQFGKQLAASGAIVVSGGARGIDTMALRGALDSTMPVVAVLGCGVDVVYPRENRFLFQDIIRHGCLISEYPPQTPPEAGHFPVRNRIISGLSLGVLVVEAPEKSGALITAELALEQGRDVYAIPGNVGVKSSAGTNRLLRDGAILVEDSWDVLRDYVARYPDRLVDGRNAKVAEKLFRARYGMALPVYTPLPVEAGFDKKDIDNPPRKAYSDGKATAPGLSGDEAQVLRVLGAETLHTDELVVRSGLPTARVLSSLTLLLIKGQIVKLPANYYKKKI